MFNKKNIPNLITMVRVALIPFLLVVITLFPALVSRFPSLPAIIFYVFVVAALSDYVDGYLARKWNVVSPFGTMMDQISDKLLVVVMLLFLIRYTSVPLIPIGIIILREIYVSGLREYMALRAMAMPVSKGGKWKTALQMLAIACMLGALAFHITLAGNAGVILLWASALMSLISAFQYTRAAAKK
jgi:CDP-diacylglycerol--glycerol-3-phosphate 3-phosphatidyltransferase